MSISVGDKYVIEIGAVAELPEGKKKYFIKPFESLVFDRKGLEQLEKFDVQALKEYNRGFEDGKNEAIYKTELIPKLKKVEYTKGYNSAINDYNAMIQWLHDCKDDFKKFMNKKYGYDVMYLTNPKVDEGVMLYDFICDHDIAEVISEFQKWRDGVEEFKVGDEVSNEDVTRTLIVTNIYDNDYFDGIDFNGAVYSNRDPELWNKTGRHFEIVDLLNQLRGNEDENND